jgi:tRNA(Arg) A34 adenosine deaminase TadA
MNKPPLELLSQYAPLEMWEAAEKQAFRSPLRTHKTGCVIYYGMNHGRKNEIYATGCSHNHDGGRSSRSTHAEMHAIRRLPPEHGGAKAIIVTLTRSGNWASCSRPCYDCAELLQKHVWGVYWAERTNDGGWAVRAVGVEELLHGYPKRTAHGG